jgi:hypothetical protein
LILEGPQISGFADEGRKLDFGNRWGTSKGLFPKNNITNCDKIVQRTF